MRSPSISLTRHLVLAAVLALLAVLMLLFSLSQEQMSVAHAVMPALSPASSSVTIVQAPNPYFRAVSARDIDTIVIHYSSGINVDPQHWDDPVLDMSIFKRYHVSAHYLIDRAGTIYQLVPEHDIAYHAGGSIMPAPDNRRNVNAFSVGIEIIATASSGYTDAEYAALAYVTKELKSRYPIRHIVGHEQIAGTRAVELGLRKDLKVDPGAKFDWDRFNSMIE